MNICQTNRTGRIPQWLGVCLMLLTSLAGTQKLAQAQPPPSLFTPAPSFSATNHYVATSVFHWFTSKNGQLTGSWVPVEGRASWTGRPDWWKSQIKQMMMANIDVLYVHLYQDPVLEQARINLFIALSQLRAEGYDTPKIAPFLDPAITWNGQPLVDLATAAGKDTFVAQYIRFYNQYYSANTDAYADDYLARQGNKPILDTYVMNTCANIGSFTRADVSNRLASAFGATHPCFTNGFVLVSSVANSTLNFADEKVHQFEIMGYYNEFLQNTIRSVQLKGGYWDQNIRNPGAFLPRAGGVNYSNAWRQVDRATTRRVYLESWNEYDEGTGLYAATNSAPYIKPGSGNVNTDVWSATGDPYEYIKTTARGASNFNDTASQAAKILWHNIPATLTPGETRTVSIIVRNTGDASWTAGANYKLGQGDADTSLVAGKRVLLNDTQDEIPTYGGLFRGRAKEFQVTLSAPAAPGSYSTHWRMLQEGVTWFGEELTVPITVQTKTAASVTLSNLSQVFDGVAKSVSATTVPAGLSVSLAYNGSVYAPASVGSYAVVGTIDDANYQGRATNTLVITANPNLFANGSFEGDAKGASVVTPPNVIDSTTLLGWRVFNVDSANVSFSATVITNASVGSQALRLEANNLTGSASYGLDQWDVGMHTPVAYGTNYVISFDAAWISGLSANNLVAYINEFDSSGAFIGTSENLGVVSVSDTGYVTFTFIWTAANAGTTEIGLGFRAMPGAAGITAVSIDNVQMGVAPAVLNGSFEYQANGVSVTSPPDVINSTAFTGWRMYNVNSAAITFSATIINQASVGSHAMQLDVINTTGGGGYALDQWDAGMHAPVQYGTTYVVSFDAAWVAGSSGNNLRAYVNEFDSSGAYIGTSEDLGLVSVSDPSYQTFRFLWKPVNPATTQIGFGFSPMPGAAGATTLNLDNVKLERPATVPVNGDFEYGAVGARAALTTPTIDSTTFTGWRIYSLGSPPINSFVGSIVNAGDYAGGVPGSHAMRLDIDNTSSPAGADYAFDTDNARVPVVSGNAYTLSFDVELDGVSGGSMAFEATIAEYDANGTFTGTQGSYTPTLPTDQTFHHYTMNYLVANPNTTQVTIGFHPRNAGFVSALVLDNVVLAPYVPAANAVTVYRAKGSATEIKMAKIMSRQALGCTFVAHAATTAHGATLTSDSTTIYVPASSVDDSFTYTFNAFGGTTATGTVVIKVGAPTGLPVTAFPNGSFESDAYGTAAGYSTPFVNTTTFANWRLFTVGSPPIALFSGTIQDASTTDNHSIQGGVAGSHALRLDVDNSATPAGADYGFDRDAAPISVTYGVTYTYTFDAVLHGLTGGTFALSVGLPEFNGAGAFTGNQTSFSPTLDAAFRTFSYSWTPINPATTSIRPAFRPYSPGFICALGLDNVMLHAPVANTDVINRAPGFAAQVRISDLLTNDTDTENHPLMVAGYSATTTNGATLTSDGTYITVPANTVSDSFTYKITDGLGATNAGTVLIPVVATYATTPTNIVFRLSGSALALSWPESHRGWFAQSNAVSLARPNYWFDIPGSDTVTNLSYTINAAGTKVFYRLRLP